MRVPIILAIFKKELLDILRDRRALISMVIVPLVAFPLLISGMVRLLPRIQEQASQEAQGLAVAARISTPAIQQALEKSGLRLVDKPDLKSSVDGKSVGAAVEEVPGTPPEIHIYVDASNTTSNAAADRIRGTLTELKDRMIRDNLRNSGIPESVLTPFRITRDNIAGERKMAGALYGSILGYILVLLMFSGGMYSALDMTAGEKERKTLEALLASPAQRREIVVGKTLAAITSIIATAALTLTSMVYSLKHAGGGMPSAGAGQERAENLRAMTGVIPLDTGTIAILAVTFIPLAVFAASIMFAIALCARSYKEGQTYLTPLIILVIFPALLGGLPGLKMTPLLCLIPIFNASQMIHGVLTGDLSTVNFTVTLAANLLYSGLALFFATRMFENERVLFRS